MESQFIGELDARHIENKWWRLLAPFGFYSAKYDITAVAPSGFVLDFPSVPRLPFAYWLAGGTGNKKSVPHDLGYRWFEDRIMFDMIFHEAGMVENRAMVDQRLYKKAQRFVLNKAMTGFVLTMGWTAKETVSGCLDYRNKDQCSRFCRTDPDKCEHYYHNWRECVVPGYHPEILKLHGA